MPTPGTIQDPDGKDVMYSLDALGATIADFELESNASYFSCVASERTGGMDYLITSAAAHPLFTGSTIYLSPFAPIPGTGIYTVTVLNSTQFYLDGTSGIAVPSGSISATAMALYEAVTGVNGWHVRIPTLSDSVDTVIYLNYNKSGATNIRNPPGVWNSDAVAIYHLPYAYPYDSIGGIALNLDSTGNHLDLFQVSNVLTQAAGQLDRGLFGQLSGGDALRNNSFPALTKDFSFFVWVNSRSGQIPVLGFIQDVVSTRGLRFSLNPAFGGLTPQLTQGGIADYPFTMLNVPANTWTMLHFSIDNSGLVAECHMAIPGSGISSQSIIMGAPFPDTPTRLEFAGSNQDYQDEVEIFTPVQSNDLFETRFNNQSNAGFYTIGPEVAGVAGYNYQRSVTVHHGFVPSTLTNYALWINATLPLIAPTPTTGKFIPQYTRRF